MKNIALGHALSAKELFLNFPIKKLKMTKLECIKEYSDGNRRDFCAVIFKDALNLVIDDIIENNVHFRFPKVYKNLAYIYMKRTFGDQFKRAFRRGKWRDVDFIASNFSGYLLCFSLQRENKLPKEKPIYVGKKLKNKITKYTNEGRQY